MGIVNTLSNNTTTTTSHVLNIMLANHHICLLLQSSVCILVVGTVQNPCVIQIYLDLSCLKNTNSFHNLYFVYVVHVFTIIYWKS